MSVEIGISPGPNGGSVPPPNNGVPQPHHFPFTK